jgi:hypothetical protein
LDTLQIYWFFYLFVLQSVRSHATDIYLTIAKILAYTYRKFNNICHEDIGLRLPRYERKVKKSFSGETHRLFIYRHATQQRTYPTD